jgi:hypothetical protein
VSTRRWALQGRELYFAILTTLFQGRHCTVSPFQLLGIVMQGLAVRVLDIHAAKQVPHAVLVERFGLNIQVIGSIELKLI